MATGKSLWAVSCSLTTALLTWSPSCQPLCHTPPGALPADWAGTPCRCAGPRSTCRPPAQAQRGAAFPTPPGSPTPLPSHNTSTPSCHLARELTRRTNQGSTTQFFPLPKWHLCLSTCPDSPRGRKVLIHSSCLSAMGTSASKCTHFATPRTTHILAGSPSRAERARSYDVKSTGSEWSSSRNPE